MPIFDDQVRMDRRYDWVGPPHPVSKIRPIKLRRVDNESDLERQYREAREELNRWSSSFWEKHNTLFDTKKIEFVEKVGSVPDFPYFSYVLLSCFCLKWGEVL
ncbi:unnamed protein product [Heligmosomoides polygyrus]|uniref:Apoptogenic protein 1, mitochondrial n=1 Tax=Heligmosomoides polygyrus TaxID=6339 RepID=A0A183G121_HELPZ|nr:unnamed protein product [Heligmosomoides polygyrus]